MGDLKGKARAPLEMPELTPNSVVLLTTTHSEQYKPFVVENLDGDLYANVEVPDYRPYESLGRVRVVTDGIDLSDEAFARRHRFPEVLEKRSKKRERERLIHDRFKLKSLIERIRTTERISDYIPAEMLPTGENKAKDLERLRLEMLEEHEDMLRRYDALLEPRGEGEVLPNKRPRKPPSHREMPPAPTGAAASAPKKTKEAETLRITIKRDSEGLRASQSAPPTAKSSKGRRRDPLSANFVYLEDPMDYIPAKVERNIEETFFDSAAQRALALDTKRRQSGRTIFAWGVLAPTAQMSEVRDFDVRGTVMANQLGR